MKIVIIGLGTIGRTLLKSLSGEKHTITIIDENKDKIENLIKKDEKKKTTVKDLKDRILKR